MMASLMRQAWSGRNARFNRVCEAAMRRSPSSRCRWLCALTPLRDGSSVKHSGRKPGIASAPSTSKVRSEEHTSELQSLMRISYAVFCLKKKTNEKIEEIHETTQQHNTDTHRNSNHKTHSSKNQHET